MKKGSGTMREKKDKTEKKKKMQEWSIAIFVIVVWIGIGHVFLNIFPEIGHPFFFFLSVLYDDSLNIAVLLFLGLSGVLFSLRKEGGREESRGILRLFFLVAGVWILILNVFPVKDEYESVLIDGKTPSKMSYKAHILKDAFSGETKVETLPVEKVTPFRSEYSIRGGRHSSSRRITTYYIGFETEENGTFASYESGVLWKYVTWMKEHNDTIQIEYYVHSGMIKRIDGVDKRDIDGLSARIVEAEEALKVRAEQEELKKRQEKEKAGKRYQIMSESVGKTLEEIKKELEAEDIPFTHNVKYISSQMYECNVIAFSDNEEVYVVRDNLEEEMIQVPKMQRGMTKEEVIATLTEAGFSYEYDTFSCSMHKSGELHTCHFGGGEWAPKGYKVWFSIDE